MKTHTIKTDNAELLLVELPQGWIFNTYKDQIGFCNEINKPITQIKGSYTLLGKPDEISEENATELVESKFIDFWYPNEFDGYGFDKFKNYKTGEFSEVDAKESLLSLIETEIYWENPFKKPDNYNLWAKYGDYTQYGVGLTTESLKWHEAEQKTFDRKRTLIFVKN